MGKYLTDGTYVSSGRTNKKGQRIPHDGPVTTEQLDGYTIKVQDGIYRSHTGADGYSSQAVYVYNPQAEHFYPCDFLSVADLREMWAAGYVTFDPSVVAAHKEMASVKTGSETLSAEYANARAWLIRKGLAPRQWMKVQAEKADHQFYLCWTEAQHYADRAAYLSDLALSSMWDDAEAADVPPERLAQLGQIWDVQHMTMREIRAASKLSQVKFAERFCIPRRTVENWDSSTNTPPDYVKILIARCLGLIG